MSLDRKNKNWTNEEVEKLKDFYDKGLSDKEIVQKLGRTKRAIYKKRYKLDINYKSSFKKWTKEETDKLIDYYNSNLSTKEIAKKLNRTTDSIRGKLRQEGKNYSNYKIWSKEEIKKLKKWFKEGLPDQYIANRLKRTKRSVESKRQGLGITGSKSRRRYTKESKERMRQKPTGSNSSSWKGGRRINHNGYAEIHKPDHHRARGNGYVFEHIVVAENKIGRKIKEKECVHHKDEDITNNKPKNLEVMTIAEHSSKHSQGRRTGKYLTCPVCGDEFYVKPSHVKERKTCGLKCASKLFREYYTDKSRDYRPSEKEKQEAINNVK